MISPTIRRVLLLRGAIVVGVLLAAILGLFFWRWSAGNPRLEGKVQMASSPTYIGEARCAPCHAEQTEAWSHSHHALAMQPASDATVLGNFDNATIVMDGVTSSFFRKDGKFYVRTGEPEGNFQNYELPYTFGIFPLQQYLVPFPKGRLQSLVFAWDSRPQPQGGQRWFHLYPDQKVPHTDPLHWTGRNQTWNYMCAECHSTNLRKNYNLAEDGYATTWSEINVSCEQCHGPGSQHVLWAQARKESYGQNADAANGLVVNLKTVSGSWWLMKPDDVTMHWKGAPRTQTKLETCAPCHSRRHPITSDYRPGDRFLDSYVPSLLEEGVYYADGQILEEDYEYGSFLQSKMYREGVSCSDCHDPHSGKLPPVSLNQVCGKCHLLSKFGAPAHHHHKIGSKGADCVNCHMPTRTYMVVDARRDHSFRVPRPDFSVAYATPNACTQCHVDRPAKWAANAVVRWYGSNRRRELQFVAAIDAGHRGTVDAESRLAALAIDSTKPAIARATALTLLPEYLSAASFLSVQAGLADNDAMVRGAAVRALEPLAWQERVPLATPLLADPVRFVRIEAARILAGSPPNLLGEAQKSALDRATSELIGSEMASAERPENHVNLASLYLEMGRAHDAENELHIALRLDPNFVPAMVNLADLYRVQNRDDVGQTWLERAISVAPNAAEPVYALGLLKARQKRYDESLILLARAAAFQPANVRFSYVYAVALQSNGQVAQAVKILGRAHLKRPGNREILIALVTFERQKGDFRSAVIYARQLVQLSPEDPQAKKLLAELLGHGS